MQKFQIVAPDWAGINTYDIVAKAAARVPESTVKLMLQSLLQERLKLSVHRETKQMDVLAMTLGRNAPRLTPSDSEGSQEYRSGKNQAILLRSTMKDLAKLLSAANEYTIDMTGLDERFDFTLDWAQYLDPSCRKNERSDRRCPARCG